MGIRKMKDREDKKEWRVFGKDRQMFDKGGHTVQGEGRGSGGQRK
jgi:hypothetical protein